MNIISSDKEDKQEYFEVEPEPFSFGQETETPTFFNPNTDTKKEQTVSTVKKDNTEVVSNRKEESKVPLKKQSLADYLRQIIKKKGERKSKDMNIEEGFNQMEITKSDKRFRRTSQEYIPEKYTKEYLNKIENPFRKGITNASLKVYEMYKVSSNKRKTKNNEVDLTKLNSDNMRVIRKDQIISLTDEKAKNNSNTKNNREAVKNEPLTFSDINHLRITNRISFSSLKLSQDKFNDLIDSIDERDLFNLSYKS